MMLADDWVSSAITDGGVLVAELLLRLKEARVTQAVLANPTVSALRWGIRQPRSRSLRCDAISHRKEADLAKNSRCSPSTPLSWSGCCGGSGCGDSLSANADGFEATSGSSTVGSRSKVLVADNPTSIGTKKLRRKKTFAELEEEEENVMKENICLEKEIALLRTSFKEKSGENQNVKRMKMEKENSGKSRQRESTCSLHQLRHVSGSGNTMLDNSKTQKMEFLLPDLNMIPFQDDSS